MVLVLQVVMHKLVGQFTYLEQALFISLVQYFLQTQDNSEVLCIYTIHQSFQEQYLLMLLSHQVHLTQIMQHKMEAPYLLFKINWLLVQVLILTAY